MKILIKFIFLSRLLVLIIIKNSFSIKSMRKIFTSGVSSRLLSYCQQNSNLKSSFSSDFSLQRQWLIDTVTKDAPLSEFLFSSARDLCPTESSAKRLVRRGLVVVNGSKRKTDYQLTKGDIVQCFHRTTVTASEIQICNAKDSPELKVPVLFEDQWCAVVLKPQGMPVYPQEGRWSLHSSLFVSLSPSTSDSGLLVGNDGCYDDPLRRPRMVHRLDLETGGIVVVAKTRESLRRLAEKFSSREVNKTYLCLVRGKLEPESGVITSAVDGRPAESHYRVIRYSRTGSEDLSVVKVNPITGRNHQIRRHMKALGHPIVGDPRYGFENNTTDMDSTSNIRPLLLYLWSIVVEFTHPIDENRVVRVEIPEPYCFKPF